MTSIDLFGYIAASLTTASFLPQALLVIRTRKTEGISLLMYAMFTLGVALWMFYGMMLEAWPVTIANGITLILAGTVLVITAQERRTAANSKRAG